MAKQDGAQLPHNDDTIAEWTDAVGVLKIFENAVLLLKQTPTGGRFIPLRDVLKTAGREKLLA